MQRFKDLCSQDSFAIKHLHPVRCLVGSFISSLSHKQLGRSSVIWDGRKDVGMGTSGSGPGPRCVWLWGGHSTCADAELLRSGLYHRDVRTYLLPRVPNLLSASPRLRSQRVSCLTDQLRLGTHTQYSDGLAFWTPTRCIEEVPCDRCYRHTSQFRTERMRQASLHRRTQGPGSKISHSDSKMTLW